MWSEPLCAAAIKRCITRVQFLVPLLDVLLGDTLAIHIEISHGLVEMNEHIIDARRRRKEFRRFWLTANSEIRLFQLFRSASNAGLMCARAALARNSSIKDDHIPNCQSFRPCRHISSAQRWALANSASSDHG